MFEQEVLRGIGEVKVLQERSLTGTWDVASLQRWKWKTADNSETGEIKKKLIILGLSYLLIMSSDMK